MAALKFIAYIVSFFVFFGLFSGILGASDPNNSSAFGIAFVLAAALLLAVYLFSRAKRSGRQRAIAAEQQQAIAAYKDIYQAALQHFRAGGMTPIDISALVYMPKDEKIYCAVYASQTGFVRSGKYTNAAFQFTVPISRNLRFRQSAGAFQPQMEKMQLAQGILLFSEKYVYFKTKDGSSHRWSWKNGIGNIDAAADKITIYPNNGKAAEFTVCAEASDLAAIDYLKEQQSGAAPAAAAAAPPGISANAD